MSEMWPLVFILVLNILNVFGEWSSSDYMKREHSLIKPYQGSGMMIPFWDFHGSTLVTSNHIRLTPDLQSKSGSLWNSVPCTTPSWEMQVHFKIHGHGKDLFGDGMAIWYAKERMQSGPVFGNQDYFHGLALIIDTYSNHNGEHNHQHPYISAMINNGSLHYDHDKDGTHTELAGCEAKLRNLYHDTNLAVRYEKDALTVLTDVENKGEWKECFQVQGVKLPTGYYFGVTAATGDLSDNHDIIAFRIYELDSSEIVGEDRSKIIPSALKFDPPRERVEDSKPAWSGTKTFLIMLFCAILLIALVIGGIYAYQQHQTNSRKRFYY